MARSAFKFQAVGQGLFVTAYLECAGLDPLRLVYDCGASGSEGRLQDAIYEYRQECVDLDLLVLSHLHDDHVSGVPQLLEGRTCRAVILPYLSPIARLAAAAASESLDPDYLALAADPVSFFLGGEPPRAQRVVFVVDGGSGPERSDPEFDPDDVNGPVTGPDQDRARSVAHQIAGQLDRLSRPASEVGGDVAADAADTSGKVAVLADTEDCHFIRCWRFRFFVRDPLRPRGGKPSDRAKAAWSAFETAARAALGITSGPVTRLAILDAIRDPARLQVLRRAYRTLGDLNTNGLALWAGRRRQTLGNTSVSEGVSPFLSAAGREIDLWIGRESRSGRSWRQILPYPVPMQNRGTGILLTGDISFAAVGGDLLSHFTSEWSSTGVVQAPHHGSRHSWDPVLFREVGQRAQSPVLWPVNASLNSRYGHPHAAVLCQLESDWRSVAIPNHEHAAPEFHITG